MTTNLWRLQTISLKNEHTKEFRPRKIVFKIFRYDPDADRDAYYQTCHYRMTRPMTVLECLLAIQDEQDGSLAFRYSCRSAVCGSCAMCINGTATLACKAQVKDIPGAQILIEPLPNFEIIKDLVVEMTPFWDALKRVEPWLHEAPSLPEKESLVNSEDMDKLNPYINCILCAACYGACTVLAREENYLGPAALTRLFRFVQDPRDRRNLSFLDRFDNQHGVWGCDTLFQCIDACPKDVRPTDAIGALRRKMVLYRIKRIFRLVRWFVTWRRHGKTE